MSIQYNSQLRQVLTPDELPKIFLKYQNIQSSPPKQKVQTTDTLHDQIQEIFKQNQITPQKEKKNIFDQQKQTQIQNIFNPRMAQGFDRNQVQQDQYYPVDFSASKQDHQQSSMHDNLQIPDIIPRINQQDQNDYEQINNPEILEVQGKQEFLEASQLKIDEMNPYQEQKAQDYERQSESPHQQQPILMINAKAEQNSINFANLLQVLHDQINKFNVNSRFHTKQFIQLLIQCHEITTMISQSNRILIIQNKLQILEHLIQHFAEVLPSLEQSIIKNNITEILRFGSERIEYLQLQEQ